MISQDTLMAYVDGELSPEARDAIDAEAARDPGLREAIQRERLLRSKLAGLYSPAMEEEVPERLVRMLQPVDETVVAIKPRTTERQTHYWPTLTAMAASLVLGLFLGPALVPDGNPETGGATLQIDGQLATALQTQLASEQGPQDAVQIGISFIGPENEICRTFEAADTAGLACRSGDRWQMRLLAPKDSSPDTEYQRASTASALVMSSAQEMIASQPMGADEERQARDAEWRVKAE